MINFKLSVKNSNDYLFLFEIQFKLNHPEIKFLSFLFILLFFICKI